LGLELAGPVRENRQGGGGKVRTGVGIRSVWSFVFEFGRGVGLEQRTFQKSG